MSYAHVRIRRSGISSDLADHDFVSTFHDNKRAVFVEVEAKVSALH